MENDTIKKYVSNYRKLIPAKCTLKQITQRIPNQIHPLTSLIFDADTIRNKLKYSSCTYYTSFGIAKRMASSETLPFYIVLWYIDLSSTLANYAKRKIFESIISGLDDMHGLGNECFACCAKCKEIVKSTFNSITDKVFPFSCDNLCNCVKILEQSALATYSYCTKLDNLNEKLNYLACKLGILVRILEANGNPTVFNTNAMTMCTIQHINNDYWILYSRELIQNFDWYQTSQTAVYDEIHKGQLSKEYSVFTNAIADFKLLVPILSNYYKYIYPHDKYLTILKSYEEYRNDNSIMSDLKQCLAELIKYRDNLKEDNDAETYQITKMYITHSELMDISETSNLFSKQNPYANLAESKKNKFIEIYNKQVEKFHSNVNIIKEKISKFTILSNYILPASDYINSIYDNADYLLKTKYSKVDNMPGCIKLPYANLLQACVELSIALKNAYNENDNGSTINQIESLFKNVKRTTVTVFTIQEIQQQMAAILKQVQHILNMPAMGKILELFEYTIKYILIICQNLRITDNYSDILKHILNFSSDIVFHLNVSSKDSNACQIFQKLKDTKCKAFTQCMISLIIAITDSGYSPIMQNIVAALGCCRSIENDVINTSGSNLTSAFNSYIETIFTASKRNKCNSLIMQYILEQQSSINNSDAHPCLLYLLNSDINTIAVAGRMLRLVSKTYIGCKTFEMPSN